MEEKKKLKILILEDERQLAKAVREAFSARGFDPVVVSTVADGLTEKPWTVGELLERIGI